MSNLELQEDATDAQISVEVTGIVCVDFSVRLGTVDGTADSPGDFSAINTQVSFANDCENDNRETTKSVAFAPINDLIAEATETLQLTLFRTADTDSRISLSPSQSTVSILDNDTATVTFDRDEVEVDEGFGVIFRINVANSVFCPVQYEFDAHISYSDPSGALDTSQAIPSSVRFGRCASRRDLVFDTRYVSAQADVEVTIDRVTRVSDGADVTSQIALGTPSTAMVTVLDTNLLQVRLEHATYQAHEAGPLTVEVRAVMRDPQQRNCPIDTFARVGLVSRDETAVAGQDYNRVSTTLTFPACGTTSSSATVTIRDDRFMEALRETFSISLQRSTDTRFVANQFPSTISILDDDRVEIGLEVRHYVVTEALRTTVVICARVRDPGLFSIGPGVAATVHLSVPDAPGDIVPPAVNPAPLIFHSGDTRVCTTLDIVDDDTVEENETFTLTLSTDDPRVDLWRTITTTVTVRDNDAAHHFLRYRRNNNR